MQPHQSSALANEPALMEGALPVWLMLIPSTPDQFDDPVDPEPNVTPGLMRFIAL
jgi:hypothetical protein